MKKLWDWVAHHFIISLIICSIIFAVIVHFLFYVPAPAEWLIHKWEAGDILTYVSTVGLGLLAMWQNQRFKEEKDATQERLEQIRLEEKVANEKTQERLEKISIEANELNVIAKLVESEFQYITLLDDTLNQIFDICGIEALSINLRRGFDRDTVMSDLKRINQLASKLSQVMLSGYQLKSYNVLPLFQKCVKIIGFSSSILMEYADTQKPYINKLNEWVAFYTETESEKEIYISMRRNTLQTVLYEKMSLEEIRNLYIKPEVNLHEKNENGVG